MSDAQAPVLTSTSLEVSNLDHFVQVLSAWHTKQVQTINHYLTIPVGQAVEVGGEEFTITPENHKGLLLGLNLALMHMGELPFLAEVEPDEPVTEQGVANQGC